MQCSNVREIVNSTLRNALIFKLQGHCHLDRKRKYRGGRVWKSQFTQSVGSHFLLSCCLSCTLILFVPDLLFFVYIRSGMSDTLWWWILVVIIELIRHRERCLHRPWSSSKQEKFLVQEIITVELKDKSDWFYTAVISIMFVRT